MKFDLTQPCDMCPFRNDARPFLTPGGAQEISEALLNDKTFACHKTVDYDNDSGGVEHKDTQHCAGALIILEKINRPNQMMRIMERLRAYDRTKLKMDSPVFKNFGAFVKAQPKRKRA